LSDVAEATRQLYQRVRESHESFIRMVDASARTPRAMRGGTVVAIAPAALYKQYRRSGADGRRIREVAEGFGLAVETIPLKPIGSLDQNAATILQWLHNCEFDEVVLVSLSKGSSDVKKALATDSNAFRKVSVWVSVGGLLDGTPLARWILSNERIPRAFRALHRIRRVDLHFFEDLDRRARGPLDFELVLPPDLRLIHIVGFPLLEHANNWLARMLYRKLAEHGPNDGFMLLEDVSRWPGAIYPVWGADHYFRMGGDPKALLERVMCVAVEVGGGGGS
jgi:hypothetical protein